MSKILCTAVRESLKAAHEAYLIHKRIEYEASLQNAEHALSAIEALGSEGDCGRIMELMALRAELLLVKTLPCLNRPSELILLYEMAMLQMLLPPSKVVPREAPMLPPCQSTLEFFGGESERTAAELEHATALYARMTDGGGGGVAEIYRAELANQRGSPQEAREWARRALERMVGDRWIEPIALRLLN